MLNLSFLGPAQATWHGRTLPPLSPISLVLLSYLSLEQERPQLRSHLASLLWPDQSQAAAYANLRQALARLRRSLSEAGIPADDLLVTTNQTVHLNAQVAQSDLFEFDELLRHVQVHAHPNPIACSTCRDELRAAVGLYRGEFLQSVALPPSEALEDWVLLKRESAHQRVLDALDTLTRAAEQAGDFAAMQGDALQQLVLEPWREEAHAQLMRALALQGQRTAALAQYHACCDVLERELGIQPGSELRLLYERIQSGDLTPKTLAAHMPRHNLPEQLTPFVGRDVELAEIAARIGASLKSRSERLLTLTGPGGMGKTRLALEVARTKLSDFADGVFFVSLVQLAAADEIAPAICAVLGVATQAHEPRQALLNFLADKHILLVLDNFEHVLAGAALVTEMLQAGPSVFILVTSREPVNVRGEQVIVVGGMAYSSNADADADTHSPALRLFEQSARRIHANFALNATNRADALRICALVDGMPLGLELAAAWCEMMSVAEIAAEIEHSFDFLAVDWPNAPARQRSLRGVFDWSWRLLTVAEQQALCGLAVFRGGFTRQAAEFVAGTNLHTLTRLVRKSLLRRSEVLVQTVSVATSRYELHPLIHQFVADQMKAATQAAEQASVIARVGETEVADRHSKFFMDLLADHEAALYDYRTKSSIEHIQVDLDNIRQAWAHAVETVDLAALNASILPLCVFYAFTDVAEGLRILSQLVNQARRWPESALCRRVMAFALASLSSFYHASGDLDTAESAAAEGMTLAKVDNERLIEAMAWVHWAGVRNQQRDWRSAVQFANNALGLVKRHNSTLEESAITSISAVGAGNKALFALVIQMGGLLRLSKSHELQGQLDEAVDYAERALRVSQQWNNPRYRAIVLNRLGDILRRRGDYEQALRRRQQALATVRETGDLDTEVNILTYLGEMWVCLGDAQQAVDVLEEAIQLSRAIGTRWAGVEAQKTLVFAQVLALTDDSRALPAERAATDDPLHLHQQLEALAALTAGNGAGIEAAKAAGNEAGVPIVLGMGNEQLGLLAAADQYYRQALDAGQDRPHHIAEAYAGLARLALLKNQTDEALKWVDLLLPMLTPELLADLCLPVWVFETCYRALRAIDEPRAAMVLQIAHRRLEDVAGRISDIGLRQTYLRIPAHRAIAAAFAQVTNHD